MNEHRSPSHSRRALLLLPVRRLASLDGLHASTR